MHTRRPSGSEPVRVTDESEVSGSEDGKRSADPVGVAHATP